ncbi:MAG: hypothetical protein ACNI3C_09125 [Candidatus Marinarcus sp.]|uniref:hypothetical protein n=1 Tax=Candidatus Marinarcus sp. TaxID=3100987 RepID=UPI003AFF9886
MRNIKDIEDWLDKYSIDNYAVSENFQVTVYGSVNLKGKLKSKRLPIEFKLVDGYFDISDNELTSLEGCPPHVTKDFNCANNKLETLFGAPNKVGDFNCSYNKLKDLSYAPKEVLGYFDCSNNELTSIKGSPRTVKDYFKCSNNHIGSLRGGPKYIDGYFDCSNNQLETLFGGPIVVAQDYKCYWNRLKDLNNIADEIGWELTTDFRLNHLQSSFDEINKTWKYKGSEVISHVYKPLVALTNKKEIAEWLDKHHIKNYKILEDMSVNVDGHVRLTDRLANLSKLPLSFNEVEGDFDISDNELITLEGSPRKVGGNFLAFKNELTSLKGGPKEVGKSFIVLRNNITSLEFSPSVVKEDFICSHNQLTSLEGLISVQGSVFSGVAISSLKAQEFIYNGIKTYKYPGAAVMDYLDREYIALTDEEATFEKTKRNLQNVINKMISNNTLTPDMINDMLLKNLTKYKLLSLKQKVLLIKNPPAAQEGNKELSEIEIRKMVFDVEL